MSREPHTGPHVGPHVGQPELLALQRPRSLALELAALGRALATGALRRFRPTVDEIVAFLEAHDDERAAFEQAAAPWRPAIVRLHERLASGDPDRRTAEDLKHLVAALECLVEHLADPSAQSLPPAELALRFERCDVSALVRSTCDRFRNLAAHRAIAFSVDAEDQELAELDPFKAEIVLLNLLFNAFKHTSLGGEVRCSLLRDDTSDTLVLSVTNSGPDVPTAQREAIFSRSLRADRSTVFEGRWLGLSLAVSRDFTRLHGGSLVLTGTPGRRSCTFEATWPVHAPLGVDVLPDSRVGGAGAQGLAQVVAETAYSELDAEEKLGASVARDHRPLVLIVEDNRATQGLLRQWLVRAYNVASAFDGVEGLEKAVALQPDLIITDVMMPQMDGDAMIRRIRQERTLADTPILIVTASDDREHVLRLIDAGFELLHKPFHHQELRARVRTLIATKQARDILNAAVGRQENNLVALATEVAQRQQELQAALLQISVERDAAARANRIKTNFLRMMSHELKTPIAAIELHLHMLARTLEAHSQRGAQDSAARMRRASRRLLHLIDTVIEWARIEGGRSRLQLAPVDVIGVLRSVVDELTPPAQEKGVSIALDGDAAPLLVTDARLVRLLIYNLVGYALQMTDSGAVRVRVRSGDGGLEVQVRDGGEPVPAALRDELFSPFLLDGDLAARAGGASVLGLHVVRDIARALDSDVVLREPDAEHGNLFVLSLRAARGAAGGAG